MIVVVVHIHSTALCIFQQHFLSNYLVVIQYSTKAFICSLCRGGENFNSISWWRRAALKPYPKRGCKTKSTQVHKPVRKFRPLRSCSSKYFIFIRWRFDIKVLLNTSFILNVWFNGVDKFNSFRPRYLYWLTNIHEIGHWWVINIMLVCERVT